MEYLEQKILNPLKDFENFKTLLKKMGTEHGDYPAFQYRMSPTDTIITKDYRTYNDDVNAMGSTLRKIGYKDENFAIIGQNSYFWAVSHMAIINGAGVSVPLDKLLKEEEITTLTERSKPKVFFYSADFQAIANNLAEKFDFIEYFVVFPHVKMKTEPLTAFGEVSDILDPDRKTKFFTFESFIEKGKDLLNQKYTEYTDLKIDLDKPCSLLFTSGTTGLAKGVVLTQGNLSADVKGIGQIIKVDPGQKLLSVLPLHHTFENTCGLLIPIYFCAAVCEIDGLRYIGQNIKEYKADIMIAVPRMYSLFYKKINQTIEKSGRRKAFNKMVKVSNFLRKYLKLDLSRKFFKSIHDNFGGNLRIIISGASPANPDIIRFFDDIGIKIIEGYGLTETAPVITGTVGFALPGIEIAIDNIEKSEPGEILARGPITMKGYLQPDGTYDRSIFDEDGWLHTGDIGHIDPVSKCLRITGRLKSMIVLENGKKVFPEELEYCLDNFALIKESFIWGSSIGNGVTKIIAKIVLDKDEIIEKYGRKELTDKMKEDIAAYIKKINASVPSFKAIKHYFFSFEDLAKTTTLKVKRTQELEKIMNYFNRQQLSLANTHGQIIDEINNNEGLENKEDA